MEINQEKLTEYQAELSNAMRQLKNNLADCQQIMGVIESFLYLTKKESKKLELTGKEG